MSTIKPFNLSSALLLQYLERLSYFNVLIQMPIYISQKGIEDALGLGQEVKGWIFFTWALVQNVTPIFVGVIADRISQEKAIFFSIVLICLGYLSLFLCQSISILLFSVILIGIGSGGFKPSLQGVLSQFDKRNVWSIYLIINNLAFMLALVFSNYTKQFGWRFVFLGSFIISILNLLISVTLLKKTNKEKTSLHINN
ncbi:MAG: MFS transporter, partial [Candidatus Kapaibacteriota bacterium]